MGDSFFGVDNGFDEDFDFGDDGNNFGGWAPVRRGPPGRGFIPNDRYSNAYANYRGGYGPGGGFGPPMGLPNPRQFRPRGPPGLFRPPGPPGPPGPMVMWGRGFGPGGPPVQRNIPPESQAFRYLLRCGLAKEVVKSIPKQMILLMEPDYCGVCAIGFDSFAMSRMHYTSRNHTKNQKKWVSQNSQFGEIGNELPLKARDLYCELCDVHITSKTHAESHYAGKPHRWIIEGRRKPKNPYLLQKGMENRVEQLIRREKRFVKLVEKSADEQQTVQAKPFQSDLYCNICKTSVTCSEQMTLHLNGKRHLSKEKRHIIGVMNGTIDEDKAEDVPTTEEIPATEAASETVEATENQPAVNQDDGDWGNGSGVWED